VGLNFKGTHQLLAYADDVNLLGDNIETIKKNTEIFSQCNQNYQVEEVVLGGGM
jgi:hypothetical protein